MPLAVVITTESIPGDCPGTQVTGTVLRPTHLLKRARSPDSCSLLIPVGVDAALLTERVYAFIVSPFCNTGRGELTYLAGHFPEAAHSHFLH